MDVEERYAAVRSQVDRICVECGRAPEDVLLVAVSKTVTSREVEKAIQAGCSDFGENRPDQLAEKQAAFPQVRWHFIGNVQSRRIVDIVPRAHLIHSVFKEDHLRKIDAAARQAGKVQDILLEVNSGEEAKGGVDPRNAPSFLECASRFDHVRVCGLMTMAPRIDHVLEPDGSPSPCGAQGDSARACFSRLRDLRDELERCGVAEAGSLGELSMGMSEDWQYAIQEGATIIRVGRAVFSGDFV